MKRTFELMEDDEKYILKNENPNDKREPFSIDKTDLKFNSKEFHIYVFEDIEKDTDLVIENKLNSEDKLGKRIYEVINDVLQKVMDDMRKKVFDK